LAASKVAAALSLSAENRSFEKIREYLLRPDAITSGCGKEEPGTRHCDLCFRPLDRESKWQYKKTRTAKLPPPPVFADLQSNLRTWAKKESLGRPLQFAETRPVSSPWRHTPFANEWEWDNGFPSQYRFLTTVSAARSGTVSVPRRDGRPIWNNRPQPGARHFRRAVRGVDHKCARPPGAVRSTVLDAVA